MKNKIQIYVTDKIKNETVECAENVGCSISDYVRMAIMERIRKDKRNEAADRKTKKE